MKKSLILCLEIKLIFSFWWEVQVKYICYICGKIKLFIKISRLTKCILILIFGIMKEETK